MIGERSLNKGRASTEWKWLMAVLLLLGLSACSSADKSDSIKLIVSFSATPEHVMINNGDSFVWNKAKITVNGSYVYESEIIPRGGTSVHLSEFSKQDGTRYDPKKNRLYSVSIYVPDALNGKPGVFNW